MGASSTIHVEDVDTIHPTCIGNDGTIIIHAVADTGVLSYSIDDINFQSSNIFDNLEIGEYTFVINNDVGCPIFYKVVLSDGNTTEILSFEEKPTSCAENSGSATITGIGGTGNFLYSIDDGIFQENNIFRGLTYGTYKLTVIDETGCRADTIANIIQGHCPVYIPNAFSPNGDGINDIFRVYPHSDFLGKFTNFQIYDRWGSLMFTVGAFDALNTGWDGRFRGEIMKPAVFVYVVEFEQENGEKILFKGDVTLLN
jgi:gliding motility-associated-like protein